MITVFHADFNRLQQEVIIMLKFADGNGILKKVTSRSIRSSQLINQRLYDPYSVFMGWLFKVFMMVFKIISRIVTSHLL
jgi:hypothetical protein